MGHFWDVAWNAFAVIGIVCTVVSAGLIAFAYMISKAEESNENTEQ